MSERESASHRAQQLEDLLPLLDTLRAVEDKIAEQTLALDALNHEHIQNQARLQDLDARLATLETDLKSAQNCAQERGQAELDLQAAQALMRRFQERSVCQERIADLDAQFDALKSAQERSAQSLIEAEGTTPTSIKPTWHVMLLNSRANSTLIPPALCVAPKTILSPQLQLRMTPGKKQKRLHNS